MKYLIIFLFFMILFVPQISYGHENSCHVLHSCSPDNDSGSYVCGDKGIDTFCRGKTDKSLPLYTLETNKNYYKEGDTIVVSGKVNSIIFEMPITFQIFWNNTSLVNVAQVNPALDGTFAVIFLAEGDTWNGEGDYVVRATYHTETKEVPFTFSPQHRTLETIIFEVETPDRGTFDIEYSIFGGEVKNIQVDEEILGIKIDIESSQDGEIRINLPREWVGATINDKDEAFIVLVDDHYTLYEEIQTTSESRTIKFDFLNGDKEIQIIGTYVVPEFGVVAFILATAIIAIILATRKKTHSLLINN